MACRITELSLCHQRSDSLAISHQASNRISKGKTNQPTRAITSQ